MLAIFIPLGSSSVSCFDLHGIKVTLPITWLLYLTIPLVWVLVPSKLQVHSLVHKGWAITIRFLSVLMPLVLFYKQPGSVNQCIVWATKQKQPHDVESKKKVLFHSNIWFPKAVKKFFASLQSSRPWQSDLARQVVKQVVKISLKILGRRSVLGRRDKKEVGEKPSREF